MGKAKEWIQGQTGGSAMGSLGRPEINQRLIKQAFWELNRPVFWGGSNL